MIEWALVFTALFVLDYIWARYTVAVGDQLAVRAAVYATAIMALNGYAAIGYTQNPWLLIPAAAGAFIGTYFAISKHKVAV